MSDVPPIRREPRTFFRSRVKVRCETWEKVVTLYTQNISRGGIFLRIENAPPVGTEIKVQLALPDGRVLDLLASVAHIVSPERAKEDRRAPGAGLFFRELEPAQRELLEHIVEEAKQAAVAAGLGPAAALGEPELAEPAPFPPTAEAQAQAAGAEEVASPLPAAEQGASAMGELEDEEVKLLAALEAELGRLRELRPWEALGIAPDASESDLASAYRRMCKRYHPDVFASWRAPEVRGAASDCFIVIKKAYERLSAMRKVTGRRTLLPPAARPAAAAAVHGAAGEAAPRAIAQPEPIRRPVATPEPIRRPAPTVAPPAPVVQAQPQAPRRLQPTLAPAAAPASRAPATTPRNFAIPSSLAPAQGSAPATPFAGAPGHAPPVGRPAGRAPVPMPDDVEAEFAPSPTNLNAAELFGDLGPTPPPQSPAAPTGGSRPSGPSASDEGLELLRQKRYGEARTRLAEALRREPRNREMRVAYHLCVAYDLLGQGREDDARKQFESVLVLSPENIEAIEALRALGAGKYQAKRSFFGKFLEKK